MPSVAEIRKTVKTSIASLVVWFIFTITITVAFNDDTSNYFRMGPSDSLIVMSMTIDTWTKYLLLVLYITVGSIISTVSNELSNTYTCNKVYTSINEVIDYCTKKELLFATNTIFIINAINGVFTFSARLSQIDIAIITALTAELSSIYTVWRLIKDRNIYYDEKYDRIETSIA